MLYFGLIKPKATALRQADSHRRAAAAHSRQACSLNFSHACAHWSQASAHAPQCSFEPLARAWIARSHSSAQVSQSSTHRCMSGIRPHARAQSRHARRLSSQVIRHDSSWSKTAIFQSSLIGLANSRLVLRTRGRPSPRAKLPFRFPAPTFLRGKGNKRGRR